MLTTAKVCALLLSGAVVGVGGTVTVQKQIAPTAAKAAKAHGKPGRPPASRPREERPEKARTPASPPIRILDCPAIGSPWAAIETHSLPSAPIGGGDAPRLLPPVGPVWGGGDGIAPSSPPTVSPGVPEPGAWVSAIIGFGLVGASMRRRSLIRN